VVSSYFVAVVGTQLCDKCVGCDDLPGIDGADRQKLPMWSSSMLSGTVSKCICVEYYIIIHFLFIDPPLSEVMGINKEKVLSLLTKNRPNIRSIVSIDEVS